MLPLALAIIAAATAAPAQTSRPSLLWSAADVESIRNSPGNGPLFTAALQEARARVEQALARPIDVPVPRDAGGYTHERHKQNYIEMQLAGILWAVTKEERYARFIRAMLVQYAGLYPTLGDHPMKSGESAGRLFWQTLNETVWLVHTAQAYDCIHDWLTPADRASFEKNIFRPMTKFFTVDHVREFDRIHNHGTWTVTAVGLAGYAMRDRELVAKALYGTKKNQTGGFLRQMDLLFSPDGYYTEGPYYFRYAIMPFMVFAQAIENNQPELKIFQYRDAILKKAVYSGLQLTNVDGAFFPLNDALKEKSFRSPEVVLAVAIAYQRYGGDPALLSIAQKQGAVALLGAGHTVAADLAGGKAVPFPYASVDLSDGADGAQGGVGILRAGPAHDMLTLAMKYTGHGLSHGHYDKLSILMYDAGNEILQDYGAARFINVESKFGGRYLPETKTWTMQTIAHNTVAVDGQSHYGGMQKVSERFHADRNYFDASDPALQVMSASCSTAYSGVFMERTLALLSDPKNSKPVVLDIFRIDSDAEHQYDLPFYYVGQFLATNVKYAAHVEQQSAFGTGNGYQHLWLEASGIPRSPVNFSWLQGNRYYTVTAAADSGGMAVDFVRIGAHDPDFNLRREGGVILRARGRDRVFASVIEPHGSWDGNAEFSRDAYGQVQSVRVAGAGPEGTVVVIDWKDGRRWTFMAAHGAASGTAGCRVAGDGRTFDWKGNYSLERK